jgi:tetratricopeptide (TPR) repeat protein
MTMPGNLIIFYIRITCLAVLLTSAHICSAQDAAPSNIPKTRIAALEADLPKNDKRTSSVRKRRACKTVVRDAEHLLESYPDAPNRYRVLGIMLQTQKLLLPLESSDRNHEALFDICERLLKAPDDYADLRLEADLLLSEKELSLKNADVKTRAKALAELLQRYRDTLGEAKSLMIASQIAPKLDAVDLEKQITRTLDERFAGDLDVIQWRRGRRDYSYFPVVFTGTFNRADGVSLTFPIDGMGHTCLIYFWSKETPGIETYLTAVKELQSRFPGQLDVFSFNLDDLPDAGEKILRTLGLDWAAMRLPVGRKSQTYRVFATRDPIGVRVNAHGHAFLRSPLTETTPMEQNFDDVRYLSQLQSLVVGDFLVASADPDNKPVRTAESVPTETIDAIQACFIAAPLRYRLTRAEALANYEKAEELCRDAITQYPKAPDLWLVRNRRIIALVGMWKLAIEPKHLETAAETARAALAANPPRGADVAPRFCLARQSLRQGDSIPEQVLSALIEATGATNAPASAYAAAAILAMDVNSRELHAKYRKMLLNKDNSDPAVWPVVSFLRDQNHRYRLFKPNLYFPPTLARRIERADLRRNAGVAEPTLIAGGPLQAELKTPTGGIVKLPQATDRKLTLIMFVEPPADADADLPTLINGKTTEDARGNKKEVPGLMQRAFELADEHSEKVKVIAAFLTDDEKRVQSLMKKNKWPCQAVIVPGGLTNPLVRRLGILSADRVPNIALVRPDGTIVWTLSGIVHPQVRSEGEGEWQYGIQLGMKSSIERYEEKN